MGDGERGLMGATMIALVFLTCLFMLAAAARRQR